MCTGKFLIDNIALQLFLDVGKWHSCDTVYPMRYSIQVKRFGGAVGSKLFKEKFIRFGGEGAQGALNCWDNWQMVTKCAGPWIHATLGSTLLLIRNIQK